MMWPTIHQQTMTYLTKLFYEHVNCITLNSYPKKLDKNKILNIHSSMLKIAFSFVYCDMHFATSVSLFMFNFVVGLIDVIKNGTFSKIHNSYLEAKTS